MSTDCGFCHGRSVGNFATVIDGRPRPPAPCPRCGDTTYPDGRVVTEAERVNAERAERGLPPLPLPAGAHSPTT